MKKRIIAIVVMVVMLFGVLGLTVCTESLADYKEKGKARIDVYVATKTHFALDSNLMSHVFSITIG